MVGRSDRWSKVIPGLGYGQGMITGSRPLVDLKHATDKSFKTRVVIFTTVNGHFLFLTAVIFYVHRHTMS